MTFKASVGLFDSFRSAACCSLALLFLGTVIGCVHNRTAIVNSPANGEAVNRTHAVESISGDAIRRHMTTLADDDMEGRETGSPGYEKAANYVADQFRANGLILLGGNGTYFQSIEFFETRLRLESAKARLRKGDTEIPLVFAEDFVCGGSYGNPDEEVTAPLVFVGYGIQAPEYGHDDFVGMNVSGRILVVLSGAPPGFATDQRAFYSSSQGKQATASALGAVGVITVRTPPDEERRPWDRVRSTIGSSGMSWVEHDGTAFESFPKLVGVATLSAMGAEKLFSLSGHDLKAIIEQHAAGGTGSFDLDVKLTMARSSIQRRISSSNVVGLVEGSDPALKNEFIVYTAHLDHLGVGTNAGGDQIYNGAYDNAAGVSVILEIARVIAGMKPAPRRSILFALFTGEEKGRQGSSYFARNPPVPRGRIVANINIDMPYLGFPLANIEAFGAEHSSLLGPLKRASDMLGLALTPDSMPEQVRFIRSDQFSFVQAGIPAMALKPGAMSSDPSVDGGAMLRDFLKNDYHQTSDDLSLPFDRESAQKFTRAALLAGLLVADGDEPPKWNEGDFFGEKFAK